MNNFMFYLFAAITGGVLGSANVNINSWKYWAVIGCVVGSYICGVTRNKQKEV